MTADIGVLVIIVLILIAGGYVIRSVSRARRSFEADQQAEMPQRLQDELAETDEYIRSLDSIESDSELDKKNRNRRRTD